MDWVTVSVCVFVVCLAILWYLCQLTKNHLLHLSHPELSINARNMSSH